VAALLVLVCGVVLTLVAGQFVLLTWARTGDRLLVGTEQSVDLDYGEQSIFYESFVSVPTSNVRLTLRDPYGRVVKPALPPESEDFRLWLHGHSGRSLWTLNVIEPGPYTLTVANANYASDAAVPDGDRLVFNKRPASLREAEEWRKVVQITTASLTFAIVVVLYVLHGRALRRAAARAQAGTT
jgi:hypothetical protein